MVRKLFSAFNREVSGIHQAALLIAASGILAKIFALYRDRLLAGTFGAGDLLDVYFAAFRVPDFLYAVSLILSTSAAVLPIFMRKETEGHFFARDFMSKISGLFILVMFFVCLIVFLVMPYIAPFVAPGFSAEKLTNFVSLSRVLLLSPFLLGFSALVSNVLQAHRRFFIYALSPVLYNLGIIAGILFLYPIMGLSGLAWGVILGALLHFLVQVPSLFSLKFFPAPHFFRFGKETIELLRVSLPRAASLGVSQLVLLTVTAFASLISSGAIAVFQLAYNLFSIPLGMVGMSYSVAAFPAMARSLVEKKTEEFVSGVVSSLRHIIFWSLPFAVLFVVLRAHIVRIILGTGAFSWTDTRLTAAALGLFSVAIVAQGIMLLLVRAFFAAGRAFFPLIASAVSGLVTIAISFFALYIFENHSTIRLFGKSLLRVEDLADTSVLILAFAFTVGSVLNAAILLLGFNRYFKRLDGALSVSVWQNMVASFVLGAVSYSALRLSAALFDLRTFFGVFLHGALAIIFGVSLSVFYLFFVKNKELLEIINAVRNKFWKTDALISEPRSASEG